jgi:hypothetical protein
MIAVVHIFETSVNFYDTTRRDIPRDCHLYFPCCLYTEVAAVTAAQLKQNFLWKADSLPDGQEIPRSKVYLLRWQEPVTGSFLYQMNSVYTLILKYTLILSSHLCLGSLSLASGNHAT